MRRRACGTASTDHLTRLVAGRGVTCDIHGHDRYDRALATCHAGRHHAQRRHGVRGAPLAFRRYSRAYVGEEARARAARRGLWAGAFVPPWDWRQMQRRRTASANASAAAPEGCAIKGNISASGRIFHSPGTRYYSDTRVDTAQGERWFCSAREARDAGWRAPHG